MTSSAVSRSWRLQGGIALVGPITDVTPEEAARVWAINVNGVLWGIQAAVAKFKELGRRGKIINASSIAGHLGLVLMRERAALAGGWIRIISVAGIGTTVTFCAPRGADQQSK